MRRINISSTRSRSASAISNQRCGARIAARPSQFARAGRCESGCGRPCVLVALKAGGSIGLPLAVENLDIVSDSVGFGSQAETAPVDRDGLDQRKNLAPRLEAERLARAPGDACQQALFAHAELHLERTFLDRDERLDPPAEHVQSADPARRGKC